jgi:hypothetical protein
MTTVVTPCHDDGASRLSQVDEPGRDHRAVGVDLLRRRGPDPTDLGDHLAVDGDVGRERLAPQPVDDRSSPDDQVVHDTIVARPNAPGAGSFRLPTV